MLVIQVRDDDFLGDDDHLQTWGMTLTETVYPSKTDARWGSRSTRSNSHRLNFQIRVYCAAGYYNPNCTQYCIASDSQTGHYTCDLKNGLKVCKQGWTGSECMEDINECLLNYCERGTCENLPGNYVCHCPPYYTGKNCTVMESPCNNNPCHNNAICTHIQDFSYSCTCVGEWEGEHCNVTLNPCKSAPCQNGAECTPSKDHTNYSCGCVYPYIGIHCDTINPDGISSTTSKKESTTIKSANMAGHAEGMTNTKEAINSKTDEAGIQHWHGILIAALLLLGIIIIITYLVVRKRHRKQKLLTDNTVVEYHNNNNLAFENNVYSEVSRRPLAAKERQKQLTPLPSTPTEDEQFTPMKPLFTPSDVDVEGAEGGTYTHLEIDMDTDGYAKPANSKQKNAYTKMIEKPQRSEQSEKNQYCDFSSLKRKQENRNSVDEVHYHDLDDMVRAVKDIKNAKKEKELKLQTVGSLKVVEGTGDETTYNDMPSNIPVACGHYGNLPASSFGGEISDDPFVSLNMTTDTLETQEFPYDIPPNNLLASTNNGIESAKSFESPNPADMPKPLVMSRPHEAHLEGAENTEQNRQEKIDGFPLPPGHVDQPISNRHDQDDDDYLLPVSVKENYTPEDNEEKCAIQEDDTDIQGRTNSNPIQTIYPENFWYSDT